MALSDKLIDEEAFARWGDMKGAPLAMCRGFARSIEAEARRDALEEAAKKCKSEAERALFNFQNDLPINESFWNGAEQMAHSCHESIRALKEAKP